nr:transporter substrate-binding domain-containing protein [Aquicoccus sp. G2-2]MEA1112732.1 transporter substrate-binding domain-containing protein [Aquicoccus sp. G2-2]
MTKSIRIGTEAAFPPYVSLDSHGNLRGFEIDMGNAVCAQLSLTCTWVQTEWTTIIPNLLAGDYDVIMAGMGITPSRAAQIAFSREYLPSGNVAAGMYVATNSFVTPGKAVISVQKGTIHEEHLRARGFICKTYPTAYAAFQALLDGKVDMTFGSPDFLRNRVAHTSRMLNIIGTDNLAAGGVAAGFRKQDTALRESFNQALDALAADGTIKRLKQKWFNPSQDT